MERALIQFMLDIHTRNAAIKIPPPFGELEELGTSQLPKFEEIYSSSEQRPYLIPTAESQ
jgi:seryl-tRNA synthetase